MYIYVSYIARAMQMSHEVLSIQKHFNKQHRFRTHVGTCAHKALSLNKLRVRIRSIRVHLTRPVWTPGECIRTDTPLT